MAEPFETPNLPRPLSDAAELGMIFPTSYYVSGLRDRQEENEEQTLSA